MTDQRVARVEGQIDRVESELINLIRSQTALTGSVQALTDAVSNAHGIGQENSESLSALEKLILKRINWQNGAIYTVFAIFSIFGFLVYQEIENYQNIKKDIEAIKNEMVQRNHGGDENLRGNQGQNRDGERREQ